MPLKAGKNICLILKDGFKVKNVEYNLKEP